MEEKLNSSLAEKLKKAEKLKQENIKIADVVREFDFDRSFKIRRCGTYLEYEQNIETQKVKLVKSNFCRERLCPLCAKRKSLKAYAEMKQSLEILENNKEGIKYKYLFLTLTIKNCSHEDLNDTVNLLLNSFNRMIRRKEFKNSIQGYYRNGEITYNIEEDTFHPHIHCILAVNSNYFKSSNYITKYKWQKLWQDCCDLDYLPILDIRQIDILNNNNAVCEVTKYAVKFKSVLTDTDRDVKILESLHNAMYGKRLTTYGGIFKEARKKIKEQSIKIDSDVVMVEENFIRYSCLFVDGSYKVKVI